MKRICVHLCQPKAFKGLHLRSSIRYCETKYDGQYRVCRACQCFHHLIWSFSKFNGLDINPNSRAHIIRTPTKNDGNSNIENAKCNGFTRSRIWGSEISSFSDSEGHFWVQVVMQQGLQRPS